jgi:hypothetical protein
MPDEQDDYPDQTKHPTIARLGRFSGQLPSATAAMRLLVSSQISMGSTAHEESSHWSPADPSREHLRAP